jgi:hypothetical protein
MESYLKSAAGRYLQNDCLIHPISEMDCLIIEQLINISVMIKFEALRDILMSYKYEKDEDVLNKLINLSNDLNNRKNQIENEIKEEKGKDKDKNVLTIRYIKVDGRRIDMAFLYGYDSIDFFNENSGITIYLIKLNPTPEKVKDVPYYANEILRFDNKEERNRIISLFDTFFISCKGLFINDFDVNKNIENGK